LPGNWMYVYYAVMGIFGLLIMVGYKYRFSAFMFFIMWCGVYFMQKSSYNNHYYLLVLLSGIMVILPAHKYASLDVKQNPKLKSIAMPAWCKWIFVIQLFILYTYASKAKLYPDWLDLSVPTSLMEAKINYPIIGGLLQNGFMPYLVGYGGILFDGLIIPMLLFKPTRRYAFFASIFFHLFNSFVFQVGVFPYLSLAFCLFFFNLETVRNIFLKGKELYTKAEIIVPNYKPILIGLGSVYFAIQIVLPLRHHFIPDDVLWTEEGHRLSWRMMLRSKSGYTNFKVVNTATNKTTPINLTQYLTKKQIRSVNYKPDFMWQFAQYLKKEYKKKGEDVQVFVSAQVSVNGKPHQHLINEKVDLANIKWNVFKHNDWILPSK